MLGDLLNLFFPKVCYACNLILSDNEKDICISCRHNLPVTNYHFNDSKEVKKIFYGRAKIENATALFHFHKKGLVQELLHNLKYRGYDKIGAILGSWLGHELDSVKAYNAVDFVITVTHHR